MKRNLILVNVGLLATAALLAWSLVGQWRQFEAEHRLDRPSPEPLAEAADSQGPASPAAAGFAAIVDHHLFNLDRSNDLPQDPSDRPRVESRPPPVLMGTMGLGGEEVALMVPGASGSSGGLYRRLKVGQALDGYTLVRIETDRVVMKTGAREVSVGIGRRSGKPGRKAQDLQPRPDLPDQHHRCRFPEKLRQPAGRRQAAVVPLGAPAAGKSQGHSSGDDQGRQATHRGADAFRHHQGLARGQIEIDPPPGALKELSNGGAGRA